MIVHQTQRTGKQSTCVNTPSQFSFSVSSDQLFTCRLACACPEYCARHENREHHEGVCGQCTGGSPAPARGGGARTTGTKTIASSLRLQLQMHQRSTCCRTWTRRLRVAKHRAPERYKDRQTRVQLTRVRQLPAPPKDAVGHSPTLYVTKSPASLPLRHFFVCWSIS